ncbi:MAG: ATP-binding protein [Luteibaculaceae bacterium]
MLIQNPLLFNIWLRLGFSFIVLCIGFAALHGLLNNKHQFAAKLQQEVSNAEQFSQENFNAVFLRAPFALQDNLYDAGAILLEKDSLQFYAGNLPRINPKLINFNTSNQLIQDFDDNWWILFSADKKDTKAVIFLPIKTAFQGYFWFRKPLELYPGFFPTQTENNRIAFALTDTAGNTLGYINKPTQRIPDSWQRFSLAFGFLAFLFFCLAWLKQFSQNSKKSPQKKWRYWLIFAGVLLLVRLVLLYFSSELRVLFPLFRPEIFAKSVWLPSLGDLLLNCILLLFISLSVLMAWRKAKTENNGKRSIFVLLKLNVLYMLIIAVAANTNTILTSLVRDSNISFNVKNVYSLSLFSFLAILSLALLFYIFWLLQKYFVENLLADIKNKLYLLLILSPTVVLGAVFLFWLHQGHWLLTFWPFAFLIFSIATTEKSALGKPEIYAVVAFAAIIAIVISSESEKKDIANRKIIAENLLSNFDPELELAYADIIADLKATALKTGSAEQDTLIQVFNQPKYKFIAENYRIRIRTLNDTARIEKQLQNFRTGNIESELFFNPNHNARTHYLAFLPLENETKIVRFRSKKFERTTQKWQKETPNFLYRETDYYSAARYYKGSQTESYGMLKYPDKLATLQEQMGEKALFEYLEGSHFLQENSDQEAVVISVFKGGELSVLSLFSYLILMIGLIFLVHEVYVKVNESRKYSGLLLREKIQLLLVAVLFSVLLPFTLFTNQYMQKRYEQKAESILSDQLKIAGKIALSEQENPTQLALQLKKLLDNEIKVFNAAGFLIGLSNENSAEIFPALRSAVRKEILEKNKTLVIEKREKNRRDVWSGYLVVQPQELDTPSVIINIPYFNVGREVESEVSSALISVLNLFAILLLLSGLASFYLTEKITQPLKSVQQALSKIELGARNTEIEYSGNNELTEFISEYNRKVKELEQKAEQLARTERESAWREMAKQVAHEIKNPLTPMQLSIQHFERTFNPQDPEYKERLTRFTKSLIFQIETLTNIANEFSSFAKMPKARNTAFNFSELFANTVNLFNRLDVSLKLITCLEEDAYLFADKEQILRVLNNLIQNAVQAVAEGKKGKITCFLSKMEIFNHQKFTTMQGEVINPIHYKNYYLIEIRDNGVGISAEKAEKIFVPYFTTKSKGTGLGLAIVKNIVESAGGKIWFESTMNMGTAFYILLPIYKAGAAQNPS